jgi:hypothetical protein
MAVPVTGTPSLAELKAWLGLDDTDTEDDVVLGESLDAALAAQARVVDYPLDDTYLEPSWTADLRTAVYLRAQRYAARRNSPEGIVGLTGTGGDFVGARVAGFDTDVSHLEATYRRIVVS